MPNHPSVNGYTGFLLRKVAHASHASFSEAIGETGLHPMHFGMLTILDAESPISQRDLSERTGVDPSTMVARMDVLEQRGLVERTRSTSDRRSYELRVTDAGQRVLAQLRRAAAKQAKITFGALDAGELAELHRLLWKLAESIDAEEGRSA